MKILGIRTSPKKVRYALVEVDSDDINFINSNTENSIKVPADMEEQIGEALFWQKGEFDRILRQNPDIAKVVLKVNEYTGYAETKSTRASTYLDAAIILAAKEKNIPIEIKLYKQIGTNSKQVKVDAEKLVGKTDKNWDEKIADALMAALSERK